MVDLAPRGRRRGPEHLVGRVQQLDRVLRVVDARFLRLRSSQWESQPQTPRWVAVTSTDAESNDMGSQDVRVVIVSRVQR